MEQNGNDGHVSNVDAAVGGNNNGVKMTSTTTTPAKKNIRVIRSLDWDDYLKVCQGRPAPAEYFNHHLEPPDNEFKIYQKLEVSSPDSHDFVHLATVVGYMGPRLQLRLDGCDNANDFFELVDSEAISPIGTYKSKNRFFAAPLRFRRDAVTYASFCRQVLKNSVHAPEKCFKPPPKRPDRNYFEPGMKLEAVDKKHQSNICPATIKSVDNSEVEIHLDGWDNNNDYKCSYYSRHIFPVGWCKKTGHILQLPGPRVEYEIDVKKQQHQQQRLQSDTSITQIDSKSSQSNNDNYHPVNNKGQNHNRNHHIDPSSSNEAIKIKSTVFNDNERNEQKMESPSNFHSSTIDLMEQKKLIGDHSITKDIKPVMESLKKQNINRKSLINSISSDHHSATITTLTSTASKASSSSSLASDSSINSSKNIDINKRKHSENNINYNHHQQHQKSNNQLKHGTNTQTLVNSSASPTTAMTINQKSMEIPLMNVTKRPQENKDVSTSVKIDRKSIVGNSHNQNQNNHHQQQQPIQNSRKKRIKLTPPVINKLPTFVNGKNNNNNNNNENINDADNINVINQSSLIMIKYKTDLPTRESVHQWSVDELIEFLNMRFPEFHKFEQNFRSHEIDGYAFLLLTNHDLMMKFLGVKLGYSLKIIDLIEKINNGDGNNLDTASSSSN
nr:sex comb on midleg-like protein 2 [Dermatophagoides farinae]